MTTPSQNPWTLDEFVERLNENAPLPQGDDARRAPAWTARLVRHYASMQAMSPPERRGRQVFYGDQHLEEAKQLTALQNAGASAKTAAWALSNQYQGSARFAPSEMAKGLAQEASDTLESAESMQVFSATSADARELADFSGIQSRGPEEMNALNGFLSNAVVEGVEHAPALVQRGGVRTENLLSRSDGPESLAPAMTPPFGVEKASPRARALKFGAASIPGPTNAPAASAQSAIDSQARFPASEIEMTPQQKALSLLNGFQGGEPFSRLMKKSAISKPAQPLAAKAAVFDGGRASEKAGAMPWKKWEPVGGLDIALREDLWPHEASLRQALAEWAKSLPEKT